MKALLELRARDALREGTRGFLDDHAEAIERLLAPLAKDLRREIDRLSGLEGLLIKRRFLEADAAWERYFWAQLGRHMLAGGEPLERAIERADLELLGLSTRTGPL